MQAITKHDGNEAGPSTPAGRALSVNTPRAPHRPHRHRNHRSWRCGSLGSQGVHQAPPPQPRFVPSNAAPTLFAGPVAVGQKIHPVYPHSVVGFNGLEAPFGGSVVTPVPAGFALTLVMPIAPITIVTTPRSNPTHSLTAAPTPPQLHASITINFGVSDTIRPSPSASATVTCITVTPGAPGIPVTTSPLDHQSGIPSAPLTPPMSQHAENNELDSAVSDFGCNCEVQEH